VFPASADARAEPGTVDVPDNSGSRHRHDDGARSPDTDRISGRIL